MVPFDGSKDNFRDAFNVSGEEMTTILSGFEGKTFMGIADSVLSSEDIGLAQKFLVFLELGYQIGQQQLAKEVGLDLNNGFPQGVPVH